MNFQEHLTRTLAHHPDIRSIWASNRPGRRKQIMLIAGRQLLGLTQRQMARHIGIPRHHLKEAELTGNISNGDFVRFLNSMGAFGQGPRKDVSQDEIPVSYSSTPEPESQFAGEGMSSTRSADGLQSANVVDINNDHNANCADVHTAG